MLQLILGIVSILGGCADLASLFIGNKEDMKKQKEFEEIIAKADLKIKKLESLEKNGRSL